MFLKPHLLLCFFFLLFKFIFAAHNPSDTSSNNPPKPNFPYNGGGNSGSLYPSIADIKPATPPPVPPASYPGGSAYNPGGGGYKPPSTNYGGGGSSYPGSNGGGSSYPGGSSYGGGGTNNGGGGSSYGGGSTNYGGGGSSYGGGGKQPTPAGGSSSGGAFSGILSGIQGFLSGQVGQFLKNTISGNKGAGGTTSSTGSSGGNPLSGLGSLANFGGFDTKSILSNRNFGLFNENKPGDRNTATTQNHGVSRSSSSSANYPTQPPNSYAGNYNYNRAYQTNAGYSPTQSRSATPTAAPKYGWNV